jgi:hypothetical protein
MGGTLAVGPALGGGFRVEARIPIDPVLPPDETPDPAAVASPRQHPA